MPINVQFFEVRSVLGLDGSPLCASADKIEQALVVSLACPLTARVMVAGLFAFCVETAKKPAGFPDVVHGEQVCELQLRKIRQVSCRKGHQNACQ